MPMQLCVRGCCLVMEMAEAHVGGEGEGGDGGRGSIIGFRRGGDNVRGGNNGPGGNSGRGGDNGFGA